VAGRVSAGKTAMRIAIFDYQITKQNPIGGCHRRMLKALAHEHEFTVFSVAFDNPCPERIGWVRVPVPHRPLALLFIAYHVVAPLIYWWYRFKTRTHFDCVQRVESNFGLGAITYSHFCHTSFLKHHWRETNASGLRGWLRWLDHRLHAWLERPVLRSSAQILVPSKGLAVELQREFPEISAKVQVLPNAVDVDRLVRPAWFNRDEFRAKLGFKSSDVVLCFAALGHFERKGLPLLLEAQSKMNDQRTQLLIVGGTGDLIESYRCRVREMGLSDRVKFAGMQADVRPYFWASDAFAFASTYETFSLVAFEAAAASLPLITPLLHGIDEIAIDGETGYLVSRRVDDLILAFERFVKLKVEERTAMGERARSEAKKYSEERFIGNWRQFYSSLTPDATKNVITESEQLLQTPIS
jgi:glycosyltransferase involved in cell wall biosynthesis